MFPPFARHRISFKVIVRQLENFNSNRLRNECAVAEQPGFFRPVFLRQIRDKIFGNVTIQARNFTQQRPALAKMSSSLESAKGELAISLDIHLGTGV